MGILDCDLTNKHDNQLLYCTLISVGHSIDQSINSSFNKNTSDADA